MKLPLSEPHNEANRTAWFGRFACVVHGVEAVEVFVSGLLIGSFAPSDVFTRNVILVGLSNERNIKKGALAAAFGVSDEHRRRLCKIASEKGMQALPGRQRGGSEPKLKGNIRAKVLKLFAEGHRPVQVFRDHGKHLGVSYTTILRMHQSWSAETQGRSGKEPRQLEMGSVSGAESTEPGLPSSEPEDERPLEDEPVVFLRGQPHAAVHRQIHAAQGMAHAGKRAVPGVTDYYVHDEDGRPVCRVDAPGTVIPNPARRRLEFSIRVSQEREGKLRNKLAHLEKGTPEHAEVESKLEEQLRLQAELMSQRPSLPKYAPVEETELSGELTCHEPHYKTVLDTIRIACLNAEAELAGELSEHMKKPAEAKKLLANIFAAPGDLRVGKKSVTLHLKFAARADERRAVAELFKIINKRNLTLPGDPKSRPLCFKSDI